MIISHQNSIKQKSTMRQSNNVDYKLWLRHFETILSTIQSICSIPPVNNILKIDYFIWLKQKTFRQLHVFVHDSIISLLKSMKGKWTPLEKEGNKASFF